MVRTFVLNKDSLFGASSPSKWIVPALVVKTVLPWSVLSTMAMVPALVWPRVPPLSVDWRIVMVPALLCRKDPSASWEDATMTVPALVLALTRPLMPMISRVPALHLNIEASRHVDIHIDVANMKEAQEAPMLDVDADPIAARKAPDGLPVRPRRFLPARE